MPKTHIIIAIFIIRFTLNICSIAHAEIDVTSIYPNLGEINLPLDIELRGSGFPSNLRAAMYADTGNRRATIGFADTTEYAKDVVISNSMAYVADSEGGLQIFDIGSLSEPVLKGAVKTPGKAVSVEIEGSMAYVADGNLQVIDVSLPDQPVWVKSVQTLGNAVSANVSNGKVYVADGANGLLILTIGELSEDWQQISVPIQQGEAQYVTVTDSKVFVAAGSAGLHIIDITDPDHPISKSSVITSGSAESIAVIDDLAVVAEGASGLEIFDLSHPDAPEFLASYNPGGFIRRIRTNGNTLYASNTESGVLEIDMSRLYSTGLSIIRTFKTRDTVESLAVAENYAIAAEGTNGIQIIDLNSPISNAVILKTP